MGVTTIIKIDNRSLFRAVFTNHQDPHKFGNSGWVDPGHVISCGMPVPWCANAQDYSKGRYISLSLQGPQGIVHAVQIWQSKAKDGDFIRMRQVQGAGLEPYALTPPMPGAHWVDGHRGILIDKQLISLFA